VGCSGDQVLACMRSKPAESLVVKSGNRLLNMGVTYAPHVDGYVLPDFPIKLMKQGKYHQVPFMVGDMKEEIRLYTMMFAGIGMVQPATINWLMRKLAGDYAQDVLKMYSYKDYRRPIDLFLNVANDMVFAGPAWQMGEAMSGKIPVYMYRVDWNNHKFPHKMGSFHGMDIPLVFNTLKDKNLMTSLMADKKVIERAEPLSQQMMNYYTNFARSGNPNASGLPDWPAYDTAKKNRMILNTPLVLSPLSDQELKRFSYFEQHPMKEIVKAGQKSKK
jgi:para-nitrobenzyl esterase